MQSLKTTTTTSRTLCSQLVGARITTIVPRCPHSVCRLYSTDTKLKSADVDLLAQLKKDLKTSMLKKDKLKTTVIKGLLSDLTYAEKSTAGQRTDIFAVLQKAVKRRQEALQQYKAGGRDDLAIQEESEMHVILQYLPQTMTMQEIEEHVAKVIQKLKQESPEKKIDMGSVMKVVGQELDSARAPRKLVAEAVKKLL